MNETTGVSEKSEVAGNAGENSASSPVRVVVFADFVCPYSFLAVDQMDRLAREYGVQPLWRPYWLHPDTPPEGKPRATSADELARRERKNAWFSEMAPDQHARMQFPDKRHYSLLAFEALEFAYDCGLDFAYKTAVYDLMWTEGADIGRTETLTAAGERVGLNTAALEDVLGERLYAGRALDAIQKARDIGITNTPTIYIGRTRINGWTYYEVLQQVMQEQGAEPLAAA